MAAAAPGGAEDHPPDGTSPWTRRYPRNFAIEAEPEDLVEAVRKQSRSGDGWIKLVGDWIDRDAGDPGRRFRPRLSGTRSARPRRGRKVTAHCFGEDVLDDMLDAGIDSH